VTTRMVRPKFKIEFVGGAEAQLKRSPKRLAAIVRRYIPLFLPDIHRAIANGRTGYGQGDRYIVVHYVNRRLDLRLGFKLLPHKAVIDRLKAKRAEWQRRTAPNRNSIQCAETKPRYLLVRELVEIELSDGWLSRQWRHEWPRTGHVSKEEKYDAFSWLDDLFASSPSRRLH
jgi:hypothetical protein